MADERYIDLITGKPLERWAEQAMDRNAAERSTDREAVARLLCDDHEARRIAEQEDAPCYDDSSEHVQRYWLKLAEALALRPVGAENVRERALEEAAKVAETLRIGGGTLSSWVNRNESPMGATQRHIAAAIRALVTPTAGNGEDEHGDGD